VADITKEAIQEIAALARAGETFTSSLDGGVPSVLAPLGYSVVQLPVNEQLRERPPRIKANVKFHDALSFVKYFGDFSDGDSRIFADEKSGQIKAVLDYHEGLGDEYGVAVPRWCQHTIEIALRKSDEWILWRTSQDGKQVAQDVFAQFIEDNSPDIVDPAPATMLEIARTIVASGEINCESAVRTNAGIKFRYNEMVKGVCGAAGEFAVPETFTIQIPIYQGGDPVKVVARLRWRLAAGKLAMWYDLWRAANIERDAFRAIVNQIAAATETTILNGTPA